MVNHVVRHISKFQTYSVLPVGLQIAMVFQSVYYLNGGEGSRKSKRFYMGFSATLLALITIALSCNVRASHTLLDHLN